MCLQSETIARFLLNKHGDLYFLLQNNSVHILSSLTLFSIGRKKDTDESKPFLRDYTNALRPRRFK